MFKQDADYPFVDWSFAGTTEEEFATLMAIFDAEDQEVYIADYEHLSVYACRIIVPCMSDIYPAEDLWLANNSMGAHLRETLLALPGSEWEKEDYLNLIAQLDDEGHDDFTRVRELLGLATGKDNGWYTLRIGELKAMLALAGGDWIRRWHGPSGQWSLTSPSSLPSAPTTTVACKPCCCLRRKKIVSHCNI